MAKGLFRFLTQLNLFNTYSTNAATIRREIITTRIYLVLLLSIFSVLVVYSAQKQLQNTVQVNNPSIKDYEYLIATYPDTLSCPCSEIAVPYSYFLTLTPIFHQVCSSDFVSDRWLSVLYRKVPSLYDPLDLRAIGHAQFELLRTLCESSKETIDSAFRTTFASESLISGRGMVLDSQSVQIQANAFAQNFIAKIAGEQQRIYRIFSAFIDGNFLWSALGTNAIPSFGETGQIVASGRDYQISSRTCECEADYTCTVALFYEVAPSDALQNPLSPLIGLGFAFGIPEFRTGCSPFGTLLKSTLKSVAGQSLFFWCGKKL
jgi:hypothetical protein